MAPQPNPYPTNSAAPSCPCTACGCAYSTNSGCCASCPMCTMASEAAAYARPQDFGTTPEMVRLMAARGVQAYPYVVFPNPDPDHDGDPLDGGKPGVMDYGAMGNYGSMYDPRQDT